MPADRDHLEFYHYVGHDAACLPEFAIDEIKAYGIEGAAHELELLKQETDPAVLARCANRMVDWFDTVFCAWPDVAERERLFPGYDDVREAYVRQLEKLAGSSDASVIAAVSPILAAPGYEHAREVIGNAILSGESLDMNIADSRMGRYAIYRILMAFELPKTMFRRLSKRLSFSQMTDIARIGASPAIRRLALESKNDGWTSFEPSPPPVMLIGRESIAELMRLPLDIEDDAVAASPVLAWEDTWMPDHTENFESAEEALEGIRMLDEHVSSEDAVERIWKLCDWFDGVWKKYPEYEKREAAYLGFHRAEDKFEMVLRGLVGSDDAELADAALLAVRDPLALGRWLFYPWEFDPDLMMICLRNMAQSPQLKKDMLVRLATDSQNDEVRVALTTDRRFWEDGPEGDFQDALRHVGEYGCKKLVRERRDDLPWMSAIELIEDQEFLWDLYESALGSEAADDGGDTTMPANKDDEIRESAAMAITDQEHLFQIAMHDQIFLVRLLALERMTDKHLLWRVARESNDEVIRASAVKLYNKLHGCSLPVQ